MLKDHWRRKLKIKFQCWKTWKLERKYKEGSENDRKIISDLKWEFPNTWEIKPAAASRPKTAMLRKIPQGFGKNEWYAYALCVHIYYLSKVNWLINVYMCVTGERILVTELKYEWNVRMIRKKWEKRWQEKQRRLNWVRVGRSSVSCERETGVFMCERNDKMFLEMSELWLKNVSFRRETTEKNDLKFSKRRKWYEWWF